MSKRAKSISYKADHPSPADGADKIYDVIIIGAGFSGMSAALTLGRACRSVLVVDDKPDLSDRRRIGGYLGFVGSLSEFREAGRSQIADLENVSWTHGTAQQFLPSDAFVEVRVGEEKYLGRNILIATGVRDVLPDIPGLQKIWGKWAFYCPHCHGWEHRDKPVAVVGPASLSYQIAALLTSWTGKITIYTHEESERIDWIPQIRLNNKKILRLGTTESGVSIECADGTAENYTAIYIPRQRVGNAHFAKISGCAVDENGIVTTTSGQTNVPRIYATGEGAGRSIAALESAADGAQIGRLLTALLTKERISHLANKKEYSQFASNKTPAK